MRFTFRKARHWRAGLAASIAFALVAGGATGVAAEEPIDTTPPRVTVTGVTAGGVYADGQTIVLHYECSDPESGIASCTEASGILSGEPVTLSWTAENNGSVGFLVTAVNGVGLEAADFVKVVISQEVNTTTSVEFNAAPTAGWFSEPLTVTVIGSDNSGLGISGVFYHRGHFWEDAAGDRANVEFAFEGTHLLRHYAINENGVRSPTRETQFRIDYTPPAIIPSIPDIFQTDYWVTFVKDEHVPFSYTCEDALSGVATCTSGLVEGEPLPTDEVGSYSIPVTATDAAGNTLTRKIRYAVTEATVDDSTPPVITFDSLSEDLYYESGKTFALVFDCADAQSNITSCVTEDGLHSGALVTMVHTPENRGLYTWTVVARNSAGLTARESITLRVAPAGFSPLTTELTLGTASATGWYRVPVTGTVLASTSSQFPIRHVMTNQGNGWVRTAGESASLLFDTEGVNVVEHYTVDEDFMESVVRESVIRIDYTPPMIDSSTPELFEDDVLVVRRAAAAEAPVFQQGQAVRFDFTCDDELSGIDECSGDLVSGGLLPTAVPGEHRYTVVATDLAGNDSSRDVHYFVNPAGAQDGDSPSTPDPAPAVVTDAGTGSLAHTGGGGFALPLGLLAAMLVALGSVLVFRVARR
jgi:hypothetical protein